MRAIAAGADNVDHVLVIAHVHTARELAHHRGRTGDFADGFLLDPQPGEDRGNHHVGDLAAHDLPHQPDHFVVEDFAMLDGALQGFLRSDGHGTTVAERDGWRRRRLAARWISMGARGRQAMHQAKQLR